ncbi:hypothetical protein BACI348_80040 [Bacillus altitudinis]|uniref:Uncharacterized protein n=1 Tax=Bacillus altitudinis TaxID=293387 RepID=A0A653YTA5_BACAB|nr:hypothetical protein BACI348_80040 [Bacillus altitudinis]
MTKVQHLRDSVHVLWVVRAQLTNVLATLQSLYQKRRRDNPWVKR